MASDVIVNQRLLQLGCNIDNIVYDHQSKISKSLVWDSKQRVLTNV